MSGIMSMLLGAVSSAAAAADEFFNRVTLLLNTGSTNGAQNNTFLDSSSNNFTITRNGNTTQGTFTPFSQTGWGNFFNGSSDYLSLSDNAAFELGSGDFTIETWVNFSALPVSNGHQATIGSKWGTSNQSYELYLYNNAGTYQLYITYSTNGTTSTNVGVNWTPTVGVWYHVAAVRSGSNLYFWINGTQQGSTGSISGTLFDGTGTFQIGTFIATANTYLNGYLSNFRLTKGGALYTSAFTPSTTPLTTTVSAGTVSLLTCQSNRFVDNSSNAFAITINSAPSVQAFSPFAPTAAYSTSVVGGSGYFDGTGDYLSAASNAAFAVGANTNFTIEAWIYLTSAASSNVIYQTRVSGGLTIGFNAGALFIAHDGVANVATYTYSPPINTWIHIAAVRNGTGTNNTVLYVNGVSVGTGSDNGAYAQGAVYISYNQSVPGWFFPGYISGLRFVNGSAVYTAAFTPPTAPPTAVTNTSLLLNYTNAGIFDAAAKNDLETVGNAQVVSPTPSKFGNSSMYFDGTGDYLTVPAQTNFSFSGDFTIECWVYFSTGPSTNYGLIDARATSGTLAAWCWDLFNSTGTKLDFIYGAARLTSASTVPTNQWVHIAVSRSGSTIRQFINGVTDANTATTSSAINSNRTDIYIGNLLDASTAFNGYIDEFRITRGYARYTANFTAPTAAFPTQ